MPIDEIIKMVKQDLDGKGLKELVAYINDLREEIAQFSPFKEPVDFIRWVPMHRIQANSYNPNKVAAPEMKLLYESIRSDGYTQPIVAYRLSKTKYEIVDGFHRNRVGKEFLDIKERIQGFLPLSIIDKPLDECPEIFLISLTFQVIWCFYRV